MSPPFPTDIAFHSMPVKTKPNPEHYLRLVCPFKMKLMNISSYVQPLTRQAGTWSSGNPVWDRFLPKNGLCSRHCYFGM